MLRNITCVSSLDLDKRVKMVEFHPTEPILAAALYNGTVLTLNTRDMSILKTIHVELNIPVRCVHFIPSMHWLIAAGDNFEIYCYDYNTGSLVASVPKAHNDLIRQTAVHPTQLLFLSSSDDNDVKLWKISDNSKITLENVYKGHQHFVMDVKFNPKDPNTFATASLDGTIKFWGLTSSQPRFTLKGHANGVNCIEFFPGNDRPYIASGSDDLAIFIWDYQTKSCVVQLRQHRENITALKFHPLFPILFSTAEDNMVLVWNTLTNENISSFDFNKQRGWTIDIKNNRIAVGYDNGLVILKMQYNFSKLITMESNGRCYWAKNTEIQSANFKQASITEDGQIIDVSVKDVSTTEKCPISLQYSSNNKYIALLNENEYSIYTALSWRNKSFGQGRDLVWGIGDTFAVLNNSGNIVVTYNLNYQEEFELDYDCDHLFGGFLIGVVSSNTISFYTWEFVQNKGSSKSSPKYIETISETPTNVWWATNGQYVAIATKDNIFILSFDSDYALSNDYHPNINKRDDEEEEDQNAPVFEIVYTFEGKVRSGKWSGDIFFFNDKRKVYFFANGYVETIAHLEKPMAIANYIDKSERLFLTDENFNFVSYHIPLGLLEFIIDVNQPQEGDDAPKDIDVSVVPKEWRSRMCTMLENLKMYHEALLLCDSDDKRFDLAIKNDDVDTALKIAQKTGVEYHYRQLATIALKQGKYELLEESFINSKNEQGLLLLRSCIGQTKLLRESQNAELKNIGFAASFAVGDFDRCIDLLIESARLPEAALMARTYAPHRLNECAQKWREYLEKQGETHTAQSIALPSEYPEKFPQLQNIKATRPSKPVQKPSEPEKPQTAPQKQPPPPPKEEPLPPANQPVQEPAAEPQESKPAKTQEQTEEELLQDILGDTNTNTNDDNNEDADVGSDIGEFLDELDNI